MKEASAFHYLWHLTINQLREFRTSALQVKLYRGKKQAVSFLTLISTVRLHSKRIGFVIRFYNVYPKSCNRFEINTVNHLPVQNMDNIKLLLGVSLINLLPSFKTCEVFLRSPNDLRGIVFITFFFKGYST